MHFDRGHLPFWVCTDGKATIASIGVSQFHEKDYVSASIMTHPVPQKYRFMEEKYDVGDRQITLPSRPVATCFSSDRSTFAVAYRNENNPGLDIYLATLKPPPPVHPSVSDGHDPHLLRYTVGDNYRFSKLLRSDSNKFQLMLVTNPIQFALADQRGVTFFQPGDSESENRWIDHSEGMQPLSEAVLTQGGIVRALMSKTDGKVIVVKITPKGETRIQSFSKPKWTPTGAALSQNGERIVIAWSRLERVVSEWGDEGFGLRQCGIPKYQFKKDSPVIEGDQFAKLPEGCPYHLSICNIQTAEELMDIPYEDVSTVLDLWISDDLKYCTISFLSKSQGRFGQEGTVDVLDLKLGKLKQRYSGYHRGRLAGRITSGTITIIGELELFRWQLED
ncbi:MAG: hypothetical protein KDA68_03670 [Planctomycetaceae bacterium]|nr:hypothetical protein [Planctomycetaceae bacterium]